jgi:uncharacterized protein (DUF1697 family)
MESFVALLRGINVGGRTSVPMAELRSMAEEIGLAEVRTYIQSGNLIFRADEREGLEEKLEAAVAKRFIPAAVIVRSQAEWVRYVEGNPFREASVSEPNRVMLCVARKPAGERDAAALQERARDGEQVRAGGGALWIHFPAGGGTSRLFNGMSRNAEPATTRNWRTVLKLHETLQGTA